MLLLLVLAPWFISGQRSLTPIMRKVDSAVLIAAACGIWSELAYRNKDTFFCIIAGVLAMMWLWRAFVRWMDDKVGDIL